MLVHSHSLILITKPIHQCVIYLPCFWCLPLCGGTLSAQHLGLRDGVNFTNVSVETNGVSISFDAQTNLILGASLDLPVGGGKLMLSPEASFDGRGYNISLDIIGQGGDIKTNINYVDLGLLAKLKIVDDAALRVYAGAGPVIGYALNGSVDDGSSSEDIEFEDEDGFNRTNLNLAIVGGLTLGEKFSVEARYMLGLNSLSEEDPTVEGTIKWNSVGINAGVRFPIGN